MTQIALKVFNFALALLVLAGLYVASRYNYLLFHFLAEMFAIVIACGMFVISWNAREFTTNHCFLLIGIAYLFVGGLDLAHTLTYKGMLFITPDDTNTATQFWIAARYVESLSLLISPFMLNRRLKEYSVLSIYATLFVLAILSILYWDVFPDCFRPETGLTDFKKTSEYIISLILLGAGFQFYRTRHHQDKVVLKGLLISIFLTIASEISFTEYADAYSSANLIGHYFKILSFYFIYKAIIETGLKHPYALLFHELKNSEQSLVRAREWLEDKVDERTSDLMSTVKNLSDEVRLRLEAENKLRRLSEKSIEALESDRKAVAKELHDGIGANLAAIKFLLEEVLIKMKENGADVTPDIKKVVFYLGDTIHETKRISARLRPLTLEELGLTPTIEAYARKFKDLYRNIDIRLDIDAEETLIPERLKIVIYRILQEALNNVGKHSGARHVRIALKANPQGVAFEIEDDGVGFDANLKTNGRQDGLHGYGLQSMRERAEIAGGDFSLTTTAGQGTHIRVTFSARHVQSSHEK